LAVIELDAVSAHPLARQLVGLGHGDQIVIDVSGTKRRVTIAPVWLENTGDGSSPRPGPITDPM